MSEKREPAPLRVQLTVAIVFLGIAALIGFLTFGTNTEEETPFPSIKGSDLMSTPTPTPTVQEITIVCLETTEKGFKETTCKGTITSK